jgi:hypothetical protein
MADADDPIVFDARNGIPAEALDQLRQASRIVLGTKDARTAVLGYWRPKSADPDADNRMGVLLLERYGPGPASMAENDGLLRIGFRESAVWPLTIDAQQDERWRRILAMLQPGDLVQVDSTRSVSWRTPCLDIRHGAFSARVPLHEADTTRQARSVRAF